MKYHVEVCEVRKGFVEVEADSIAEAKMQACIEFGSEIDGELYSLDATWIAPVQ